jgi:signal transduction histidine kinase/CheY-like chemotaxis protein
MLASAMILGIGVTLLMLALARARELRIRELALRNAVIEAQVAQQTQELAAARDEALVAARAKSDFLARMSHEIRTPLNAILGSMEALMDTQATPAQSHLIRMCERAGQGLLVLINDVLDLAKIEAGQLLLEQVEFSPREVLEDAVGMHALAAAGKGIELATDLSAGLPLVCRGDPVRLRQVLLNLLGNAIKFTREGEVVLNAWVEEETGTTGLPMLRFQVRDTGIGIPSEKLETVFERFAQADSSTTRRYGGTGLGLSISRELMEGMGGRLWAENPAQGGCCLQGSLPLQVVTHAPLARVEAANGRRVLLVEGGSTQRECLKRALESLGADVRASADGATAASQINASWHPTHIIWGLKNDATDPLTALDTLARACPSPPRRVVLLPALSGALPARCAAAGVEVGIKPPRQDSLLAWLEARAGGPDATAMPSSVIGHPDPARHSLLLVEDNDDNRQLVHVFLRGQCWDITDAVDGVEAVRLCNEHAFDLVLMDIQMPRMDGHAATREIRQSERASGRPATRIIALTAHALPEELERTLAAGCDGYLTKPLKKKTLLDFLDAELTSLRMNPASPIKEATVQADTLGHG